jgi:hypothetical protein
MLPEKVMWEDLEEDRTADLTSDQRSEVASLKRGHGLN